MSKVKRWYVSPRTIELFLRAGPSSEVPAGFVGITLLSEYDALAQRCCNLEVVQKASLERSGRIKAAAGHLGWTADREDSPLEFMIAQAQRCRELEAERNTQLGMVNQLEAEKSELQETLTTYIRFTEEIAPLEQERDALRAEVEELRKGAARYDQPGYGHASVRCGTVLDEAIDAAMEAAQ